MGGQHLVLPFQKNVQLLILHFFMATLKNILLCAKYLKDKKMFGILIFRSKELYFLFVCLFFIETLGYNTDKKSKVLLVFLALFDLFIYFCWFWWKLWPQCPKLTFTKGLKLHRLLVLERNIKYWSIACKGSSPAIELSRIANLDRLYALKAKKSNSVFGEIIRQTL